MAAAAVVGVVGMTVPATSATAAPEPTGVTECLFTDHDRRQLVAAENSLGRQIRCASLSAGGAASWSDWTRPWFVGSRYDYHRWDAWVSEQEDRHLVVELPMVPADVPADWRARGAKGEYDAHARALATTMIENGLGDSVIRPGAGADAPGARDGIGSTVEQRREWAAYWARLARAMNSIDGARFTFDLTLTAGQEGAAPADFYPGDDVVDVIGIDQPDRVTGTVTGDRFDHLAGADGGLGALAVFAESRGKPISLPSSALVSEHAGGAGDDPDYVTGLAGWAAERDVAYVGLVSSNAGGGLKLHQVPRSRTAWRSGFTDALTLDTLVGKTPASGTAPDTTRDARPVENRATQCPYVAHDLRRLPEVEKLLGTSVHCAVVFHDYMPTWEKWERPWFTESSDPEHRWDAWVRDSGGRNRLVMTLNLVPTDVPADWRRRGAEGEYDAHIRRLTENLVAKGLGTSVIRLGSEANGDWRPDQVGDTVEQRREWARYWARFVEVTRTVPGADFTFDWNVNAGYRPIPFEQYYPGDDVVDIIGIDQYDSLPAPRTSDRWGDVEAQKGGIAELAAFARSRGKPLSLPEVGLVSSTNHGADDNPSYIDGLASYIDGQDTAYIGYFDKRVGGTLTLSDVPRSAERWRRSFVDGRRLNEVMHTSGRR